MKKVVLVTGASKGIGNAVYSYLTGTCNLIICDKTMKPENRYNNIISIPCDITDKEQVQVMVNKGIEKFGRIDVLINNAGIYQFNNFEDITEEELNSMYQVNVKGILLCSQAVLPIMLKQNSGKILNILSIRSHTGAPTKAAYSASKFAAKGLMDSLRMELKSPINITNICPGKVSEEDVTYSDLCKTVDYLLSLSDKAIVRDIILGGQL